MGCTVRDSPMHALLLLSGLVTFSAPESCIPRVSVKEGDAVTLRCVFSGGDGSGMQWVTPSGFAIFFNDQKVLRDRRFGVVRSLKNNLIIRLSNVTIADEGIYSCIQYSSPARVRRVNVSVLAVPSNPVLDFSQILGPHGEFYPVLKCFTRGCKPAPEITWLIDNSTEVFGDTELMFEDNGKKCDAASTLRIRTFSHGSSARCILRHEALRPGDLSASFIFHSVSAETQTTSPITSATSPITSATSPITSAMSSITSTTSPITSATSPITSATSPITSATSPITSATSPITSATSPSLSTTSALFTETPTSPRSPGTNVSSAPDGETISRPAGHFPPEMDSRRKSSGVLVLVLVTLMVCVLLVIVHFFLMKLRKQHTEWKKENEISDQTLESTKSRSNNEDISHQPKTGQAPIQYTKETSV